MRIAMVVERFPPDAGGSGKRFFRIAEHLSGRHAIDVFTLGSPSIEDQGCCFRVYRLNPDRLPFPNYHGMNRVVGHSLSTFFQLLARSYDVVDIDIWPMFPFFLAKIAAPSAPAIVSWNVVWPFSFHKTISRVSTVLAYTISKLSTYNITVSRLARMMLLKHLKMNPSKIDVIPNGIDEVFFKARPNPQWGRTIFVGRLEPQKRLDLLIEAFKIARQKMSEMELHVIGSGPLYPQLLRVSRKLNGLHVYGAISAHGTEELISKLSKSWVFVSASEFETYGLAIAESLSLGLPVVLTKTQCNGAVDELVKHNYNGLIVEHNKPEAIAEALEHLYENEELWKKLSYNAKYSTVFHSWDYVAQRVEAVYKRFG